MSSFSDFFNKYKGAGTLFWCMPWLTVLLHFEDFRRQKVGHEKNYNRWAVMRTKAIACARGCKKWTVRLKTTPAWELFGNRWMAWHLGCHQMIVVSLSGHGVSSEGASWHIIAVISVCVTSAACTNEMKAFSEWMVNVNAHRIIWPRALLFCLPVFWPIYKWLFVAENGESRVRMLRST